MQDKLDKKFDIAFGIAGLAQLASGFALVLILAGENVSCRHHQHVMRWAVNAFSRHIQVDMSIRN